jgi:hypothetical protein
MSIKKVYLKYFEFIQNSYFIDNFSYNVLLNSVTPEKNEFKFVIDKIFR